MTSDLAQSAAALVAFIIMGVWAEMVFGAFVTKRAAEITE